MADFHQGSLDPLVLQALCALGLRQLSAAENIENIENADETMSQVEATILASMGEITLSRLQALALLLHYRRMSAKRNELWMLLSLATRMAFTLCLNHEHHDLAPVHQECNRRLMWSIYMLDTLGCAGIDSLAACPLTDIHIRLPCDEHSYAFGVASVNPRLDQAPSDLTTPSEDALAKILRLMPIRHEVLKYSRRVIASGQSPWDTRAELDGLCDKLLSARSSLPAELQLTKQNLTFRATSPYFTTFVMLHAHWYQIFCDLYRLLLPDRRESVSKEAFASTPPEYLTHCQKQCLASAQEAMSFFELVHDLPGRNQIDDSFFGVIAYQMAQMLSGGYHILTDAFQPTLRLQLQKLLLLLKQSEISNLVSRSCALDLERIISAMSAHGDITPESEDNRGATLDNPAYVFVSRHSTLPITRNDALHTRQNGKQRVVSSDGREDALLVDDSTAVELLPDDHVAGSQTSTAFTFDQRDPGSVGPLWRPTNVSTNFTTERSGLTFADGDIFGLYNFAPDYAYYVDPFDMRFDQLA